jgi:hypothetical protein
MWNLRQTPSPMLRGVMLALLALLALAAYPASAQTQNVTGQDAVYNSSNATTPSPSFIDASVSQKVSHTDLCATIYNIFTAAPPNPAYPAAGAVIDARSISGTTALTCAAGKTPWNNGTTTVNSPSNILLPATGGGNNFTPIVISTSWVLPPKTHLIGGWPSLSRSLRRLGLFASTHLRAES